MPIVVAGPWPGTTTESSAKTSSFSRMLCTMSSSDVPPRSQRPTPPRKSVSPVSRRVPWEVASEKLVLPGVLPGGVVRGHRQGAGAQDVAVAQVAVEAHDARGFGDQTDPSRLLGERF